MWTAAVLVAVAVGLLAYDGVRLGLDLRAVRADAARLKGDVAARDVTRAHADATVFASHSASAHRHADALMIRAVSHLPWIGGDVRAVRVLSRVLDDTSRHALPSALRVLDATSSAHLRLADGSFDLAKIAALQGPAATLDAASQSADREVQTLSPDQLVIPPVRRAVAQAQDIVGSLASTAGAADTAVRLVPAMMGQRGARHYLLVVQNNAEIRATGGLIGSLAPITVDHGKLKLGPQIPDSAFPIRKRPVIPLTKQEVAVYGSYLGEDLRDTNLTPSFPRTAQLVQAMYRARFGRGVDGVISVDPVALSLVLAATGPIQAPGETFTADNVVQKLLHDVYQRFPDGLRQNLYFASAAGSIFQGVSHGQGDIGGLLKQVAAAATQRRLLVWSSRPEEQKRLDGTAVGGTLTPQGSTPDVGIYLNDGTVAKMEYYLRYTGSVRSVSCSSAGQVIEAKMQLRSTAPSDLRGLATYITGTGQYAPRGTMRLNVRFYSPAGGTLTSVKANGQSVKLSSPTLDGRQVGLVVAMLQPHGSLDFTARFLAKPGSNGNPVLRWTPGMTVQPNEVTATTSCG